MNRPRLCLGLPALALSLIAGAALGGDTRPAPRGARAQVKAAVIDKLVEQHHRRTMFSRAVIMPPRYELHVAKGSAVDVEGATFVTFNVGRHAPPASAPSSVKHLWPVATQMGAARTAPKADAVVPLFVGCVYPASGDVYVAAAAAPEALMAAARHPQLQPSGGGLAPDNDDAPKKTPPTAARAAPCRATVPVG